LFNFALPGFSLATSSQARRFFKATFL